MTKPRNRTTTTVRELATTDLAKVQGGGLDAPQLTAYPHDQTAFANFDQKANLLMNMLSSVTKTTGEMTSIAPKQML